jgi:hypothetical protein
LMGPNSFAVESTRRQFQRYRDYFMRAAWKPIVDAALEALGPSQRP